MKSPNLLSLETLGSEMVQNFADKVREISKSWDNRLDFPPTKISERYLSGDLAVRIEGSAQVGDISLGKIAITLEHDVHIGHARNANVECSDGENQFAMFVGSVHIVDDPKRVTVRPREQGGLSVVRLQCLYDTQGGLRDALYFSFKTGDCVFVHGLAKKDREAQYDFIGKR